MFSLLVDVVIIPKNVTFNSSIGICLYGLTHKLENIFVFKVNKIILYYNLNTYVWVITKLIFIENVTNAITEMIIYTHIYVKFNLCVEYIYSIYIQSVCRIFFWDHRTVRDCTELIYTYLMVSDFFMRYS